MCHITAKHFYYEMFCAFIAEAQREGPEKMVRRARPLRRMARTAVFGFTWSAKTD